MQTSNLKKKPENKIKTGNISRYLAKDSEMKILFWEILTQNY